MTTPVVAVATALLFLLLHRPPAAQAHGSVAPIAIVHGSGTVCGVLAGPSERGIVCARGSRTFQLLPNVSFASVSGGRDFLCGLRSEGRSFFCWTVAGEDLSPRRLYRGPPPLEGLTVGEDHIAASVVGGGLRWWRGGRRFPDTVAGQFRSLSSGNGFSCAIHADDSKVNCWASEGRLAEEIQSGFANVNMSTLVAGDFHACGITSKGFILCTGRNETGQLNPPSSFLPFEFSRLAVGRSHSCAIKQSNGTVVCWGGGGGSAYQPVSESMEWIVAGGDLTCGVTTRNFSVICWVASNSTSPSSVSLLPLRNVLPGICTKEGSCDSCGEVPNSLNLCGGSGVICRPCGSGIAESPSPPPAAAPRRRSRWFLAFAIVGSVGAFAGACTIAYCIWAGVCRQKRVHNSVQPTITGAGNSPSDNSATTAPPAPRSIALGSISKSRSRSRSMIFRRPDQRAMNRQRSGPSSARDRAEVFSIDELAAATKNFSMETKIGAGSFGTVYKGKLADGREVAIKRSESAPKARKFQEKESAFQSELIFLSRLHHKHLVGLVGFCEDDDERLLVYEFMENGALYDHLHSRKGGSPPSSSSSSGGGGGVLNSWKMRIKVLLDTARGIEYLHNYAVPPIIHRDIKSSNILLDANWTAKVSDFGLSLNGPNSDGGHLSLKAAGTVGYMDPEYYGLHHLTVKSDVYGLGVVMLEVLTGKRAIFKEEDGNPTSVVDYAVPRIAAGEVAAVLDPRVGLPAPLNEAEAVELLAYVAVHCVSLEGRERPTMTDIVANLESALALCEESHGSISSAGNSVASYD
ncbi:unnamed protein product [Spirodela intermedia]|uniref:Protein kinase domain-containing protein n=1 Tax=Spirodela intermedia TaxID=51605 RepID=A0A7I8JZC7_SPIIN|nr:unnamed protein product [Spirodela intermedia]